MDKNTKARIRKQIKAGTIYKKAKYRSWRSKVFKRDRYTCQLCKKVGGSIQAHHIKPKYKNPEKIYEALNGITLCYSCHQKVHKEDLVDKHAVKFRAAARKNKPKPTIKKARKIRRFK
jgi:5-methylcytosine-specific restriction endonuclease McrA